MDITAETEVTVEITLQEDNVLFVEGVGSVYICQIIRAQKVQLLGISATTLCQIIIYDLDYVNHILKLIEKTWKIQM